jgi:hypothetical protein
VTAPEVGAAPGVRSTRGVQTTREVQATREVRDLAEAALTWVSAHRDGFALGDDALAEHGNVNTT